MVIVETGADPLTVSHGQEAGPIKVRHSVEAAAHRPPATFLRCAGLDTPPEDDLSQEQVDEIMAAIAAVDLKVTDVRNQIGDSHDTVQTGLAGQLHKSRRVDKATAAKVGLTDAEIAAAENG